MHKYLICLLACFSPLCSAENAIKLEIINSKQFEVFYHRASVNMVGAAAGGLIGAAIQGSHEASQDKKKLALITADAPELPHCDTGLRSAITDKLASNSFNISESTSDNPTADAQTLKVVLHECGVKVIDTSTMLMSVFVKLKVKLFAANTRKKALLNETIYVTGKTRFPLEDLTSQKVDLSQDLTKVIHKAGKRLANKIIYL